MLYEVIMTLARRVGGRLRLAAEGAARGDVDDAPATRAAHVQPWAELQGTLFELLNYPPQVPLKFE